MDLEEANGPKEARRERSSKLIGSAWCSKVRMGHSKPETMQAKKVRGWWRAHEPPRMKDKVIGPGKLKGVSKSLWECIIRKGQGCLGGNKWDAGARKQCSTNPNNHTESLREE